MANLTAGKVVQLKSGGPYMTVRRIHTPTGGSYAGIVLADCQWFVEYKPMEGDFPVSSLEEVTE